MTTLAIGCDEAACALKETLKHHLVGRGLTIQDFGTHDDRPVLYPDVAFEVAQRVASGEIDRAILLCGTGIGMAISANKVPGIRAAQCHDTYSAERASRSNDAQIITLGARVVGPELAKAIVDRWLDSHFDGGRSLPKVARISAYEGIARPRGTGGEGMSSAVDAIAPDAGTLALAACARNIRRHALRMGAVQGQGYVGQALGIADVLAVAYFHALRMRPEDPRWEGRDRFLLSIGHYAIALYAVLIEAGVLPLEELESYGSDNSRLPMSGMASYTPGMEITGGSLGHGLGVAVGRCLALRHRGSDAFVYNLLSDGELDEGSTWEAAMSAGHWRLSNLIAIVDVNNQQADGPSTKVMNFEPLSDKWQSFGWHVQRVDGNDLDAVRTAFDAACVLAEPRPRMILCDTRMGCGVPFLEGREKAHFMSVEEAEWQLALQVLDKQEATAADTQQAACSHERHR